MEQVICRRRMEDKYALAALLNNSGILANLQDGIPCPCEVADAEPFARNAVKNGKVLDMKMYAILKDTEEARHVP